MFDQKLCFQSPITFTPKRLILLLCYNPVWGYVCLCVVYFCGQTFDVGEIRILINMKNNNIDSWWTGSQPDLQSSGLASYGRSQQNLCGQCSQDALTISIDQLDPEAKRWPGPIHGWLLIESDTMIMTQFVFSGSGRHVFKKKHRQSTALKSYVLHHAQGLMFGPYIGETVFKQKWASSYNLH